MRNDIRLSTLLGQYLFRTSFIYIFDYDSRNPLFSEYKKYSFSNKITAIMLLSTFIALLVFKT